MYDLFLNVLKISFSASVVALVVMLSRLALRQAPKVCSYALWGIVFLRLLCPLSFTVNMPVVRLPRSEAAANLETMTEPDVPTDEHAFAELSEPDNYSHQEKPLSEGNAVTPDNKTDLAAYTSEKQEQEKEERKDISRSLLTVLAVIWLVGFIVMICMSTVSYAVLRRRLAAARRIRGNIYQTDRIKTAFVLGIFRPRIYLPSGINAQQAQSVVLHEQAHIRHGDNIVKLIAFFALSLHWFNPVVWLSYKLMCADMEQSCDEAVVRMMRRSGMSSAEAKKAYGRVILSFAADRSLRYSVPHQ